MGDGPESWTGFPGGAPANVACALAKLGTPAAFVGAVVPVRACVWPCVRVTKRERGGGRQGVSE